MTELWGSLGEDAGVKVVEALGNVTEQYGEVNGAAQKVLDTTEQSNPKNFKHVSQNDRYACSSRGYFT